MNTLLDNGIPVASSCGGDGICGKCKVHISNGWAGITPASENEKFVLEKIKAAPNTRLSCQVLVQDDLEIDASYW
jgi:2Fe-2S ferredoxin